MTETGNLKEMQELIKIKNENSEEYKKFLNDLKEVMKDISKIAQEVVEELE